MNQFQSILIANRGEIAVRVMGTAKRMGFRTIAVHSDADAQAPHVRKADAAIGVGPAPASESYLNAERILEAARYSGAEAVHPGYGFLSENAEFVRACEAAGFVFIGPTAEAVELMGNKAEAKRRMADFGIPGIPGYHGAEQSDDALLKAADEIGFPLMVKAAAGGGGRGMRLVSDLQSLREALGTARSEARSAFGSNELILERALLRPRHVEVQVFADAHGAVVHLGERDCSVQRRHQKVIEEAPCPVMTETLRTQMGQAAVEVARSIGYRGAGTVEFLLDGEGQFYFLEMNTRLQVEHPVTELITGLDLVELQIRVAQGEPLGFTQEEVSLAGHAIEARLYAEDPAQGFLPCTGRIELWQPATGTGVRVDGGIESGQEVSAFYDPMLAKLIAWGEDRDTARRRLLAALNETVLLGPETNKRFLAEILRNPTFAQGKATTAFIDEKFSEGDLRGSEPTLEQAAVAAVIQFCAERDAALAKTVAVAPELLHWSSTGSLQTRYRLTCGGREFELAVFPQGMKDYLVKSAEGATDLSVLAKDSKGVRLQVNGHTVQACAKLDAGGALHLAMDGDTRVFRDRLAHSGLDVEEDGAGRVLAPMHGKLVEMFVQAGDSVQKGKRLAVLEAMKMQHDLLAEVNGVVREIHAHAEAQVAADELLFEIELNEEKDAGTGA